MSLPYNSRNPNAGFVESVSTKNNINGLNLETFTNNSNTNSTNNSNTMNTDLSAGTCTRANQTVEVDELANKFTVGGDLVLTRICPHNQCPININEKGDGFICPCHASKFDKCGNCLEGPACPNSIRTASN